MERQRQFQVVEVEVQSDKYNTDLRVEEGLVAGGDLLVVIWLDVAAVGGVRPADEGDVLGAEFLFDAGFADDEDFALVWGELEDARDVY